MNKTIWGSSSTEESASLLASKMGCSVSRPPSSNFKGSVMCFGAKPKDIFKWENRDFDCIVNDPRKISEFSKGRISTIVKLSTLGLSTAVVSKFISINESPDYQTLYSIMSRQYSSRAPNCLFAFKENPNKYIEVKNQNELEEARQKGYTWLGKDLTNFSTKTDYFVLAGEVISSVTFSKDPAKMIRKELGLNDNVSFDTASISRLINTGVISIDKLSPVQTSTEINPQAISRCVTTAISKLGGYADFYRISVCENSMVCDITHAPSLTEIPVEMVSHIATKINSWMEENALDTKTRLLKMIEKSTDAEAEAIMQTLMQSMG